MSFGSVLFFSHFHDSDLGPTEHYWTTSGATSDLFSSGASSELKALIMSSAP